jgi:hypothetical protein
MARQSSKELEEGVVTASENADPEYLEVTDLPAAFEKRGTEFDVRDMNRMGKLPELRVRLPRVSWLNMRLTASSVTFVSPPFSAIQ